MMKTMGWALAITCLGPVICAMSVFLMAMLVPCLSAILHHIIVDIVDTTLILSTPTEIMLSMSHQ